MMLGKRGTKISQRSQLGVAVKALDYKGKEKENGLQFFDYVNPFTRLARELEEQKEAIKAGEEITLSRQQNRLTRKAIQFVCENSFKIVDHEIGEELKVFKTQDPVHAHLPKECVYAVRELVEYFVTDFTESAQKLGEVLGEEPKEISFRTPGEVNPVRAISTAHPNLS